MLFKIKKKNLSYYVIIFLTTFFFCQFFLLNNSYSNTLNDIKKNDFCENIDPEKFINQKTPIEISIETNNSKKWAKNIFSLFLDLNSEKYRTNNKEWYTFKIKDKYKKKFKSKVKFKFKDPNYECISRAKVSVRGDLWWHLDWKNGYPFSSLRVDLENGHLNNLVKFNLLIPKSRNSLDGDVNLELYVTALFNKVNLLAPKSRLVKVNINGKKNTFLFQEIFSKEFLESRNLVEGPLFEGDQQYTAEQFANKKWRGDLGLARIINASYTVKSRINSDLSLYALSVLNNVFIDSSIKDNLKKDNSNDRCVDHYLTINKDKYLKDFEEIKTNQIYESLIFATQTDHSLTCDDRKFYFDPIKYIFIPIYNDGKSTLNFSNNDIYNKIKDRNVTDNSIAGSKEALKELNNIDEKQFFSELKQSGFTLEFNEFLKINNKVKNNLIALNKTKSKIKNISSSNYFKNINSDYFGKELKLIFLNLKKNKLDICNFELSECNSRFIDSNNELILKSLFSQNFSKLKKISFLNKKNDYLFLSMTKNYSSTKELFNFKDNFTNEKINDNFNISYNKFTKKIIDEDNKHMKFILLSPKSRIKIMGKLVDSWSFEIDGSKFLNQNHDENIEFNNSKLTGCLTFIDIKLKNIHINSNNSLCEDSYNFIRSSGSIQSAKIINSLSDGLDFDFSNISINKLNINNSQNDCIDMSFGSYKILKANIKNCGDKGVSVGEKSKVSIKELNINNVVIGVASKDSSDVFIDKSNIDSQICFAAYRKKQEFSGSILTYNKTNCNSEKFAKQIGSKILKK